MTHAVRFIAVVGACWVMAACGEAPPPFDTAEPTGPITQLVTADGTTLRVVGDDRGVLELIFPPEGVHEDIDVTVSPRTAATGGRARFDVAPAGVLLRKPLAMVYTAPAGVDLDAQSTFTVGPLDDVLMLPSTRVGVASLATRTWVLGAAEAEALSTSSAHGGAGISINIADIECQLAFASLSERLERARGFPFSSAVSGHALVQQIEANNLACAGDPAYFDVMRPIMQEAACAGARDASADASVATVDSVESLKAVMGPILNWEGSKQATGTDCGRSDREYLDDLEPKFDEFIDAYKGKIASGKLPTTYEELWTEVRGVLYGYYHTGVMNLAEASSSVEADLLGPMFDLLRDAAYEHCRSDSEQAYLVDLLMGGGLFKRELTPLALTPAVAPGLPQWARFGVDELLEDIQYCASRVVVEVFTPLPRLVGELTRRLEGSATPGDHVKKASTRAPATGNIVLDGAIGAFQCISPDRSSDDVLVVRFNGVEVDRITRSGEMLLGSQRTLDVGEMLTKAGLDPTLKRTYPLVLEREGESCATLYGYSPTELFTFDVEIDPAPTLSRVTASTSMVEAERGTDVTFRLAYVDEGENLESARNTYALAGNATSTVISLADSDRVAGFGQAQGTGTFTPLVTIYCSEQGKNPLRIDFVLIDAFDQESDSQGVDMTVVYEPCEA